MSLSGTGSCPVASWCVGTSDDPVSDGAVLVLGGDGGDQPVALEGASEVANGLRGDACFL